MGEMMTDARRLANREACRRYEQWHREERKQRHKVWRDANREYMRAARSAWLADHPGYSGQQMKKRRDSDFAYRLWCAQVSRIHTVLHDAGAKALRPSRELIGCSRAELLAHISAQLKPGMTEDNYSRDGWHVDHICPLAAFDLREVEMQRIAFHWTNLQPLWGTENRSKGARRG